MVFKNRTEAGKLLAHKLASQKIENPVVIALPRGGVPVAYEISKALNTPLDVLVVRKLGMPSQPEYGIGAITEEGYYWVDPTVQRAPFFLSQEDLDDLIKREGKEVERRVKIYRGNRALTSVKDRTIILVDDGLATGVTAKVGANYLKQKGAKRIILAIPVCAPESATQLRKELDEVICLFEPEQFWAVGLWYSNFEQVSDDEVNSYLHQVQHIPMAKGL